MPTVMLARDKVKWAISSFEPFSRSLLSRSEHVYIRVKIKSADVAGFIELNLAIGEYTLSACLDIDE